jgi:hypothetical protein
MTYRALLSPRRALATAAATSLAATALAASGSPAQALPCRDFCPSWDPFSFTVVYTADYWAYNRYGKYVFWHETGYLAPNGQTIRECGYADGNKTVAEACPR